MKEEAVVVPLQDPSCWLYLRVIAIASSPDDSLHKITDENKEEAVKRGSTTCIHHVTKREIAGDGKRLHKSIRVLPDDD